jgi:superfamily I DNA/RNA helicase
LEAAHIKDLLALLRFVENPRDRVAGFRVLQLMPGVGSASAQRVLDHMTEAADPIHALADAPSPPRAGDNWPAFVETVTRAILRDAHRKIHLHFTDRSAAAQSSHQRSQRSAEARLAG